MFKLNVLYIILICNIRLSQCIDMLRVCSDMNDVDVYCDFSEVGEYNVSTTYPNAQKIQFQRLTTSWINGAKFPNLMFLNIIDTVFDTFKPCKHIERNRLKVNVTLGYRSEICVSIEHFIVIFSTFQAHN